jgi:phosphate:Na+ symporter
MDLTIGQLIAGVGLFFYGLNTVSSNLQQISSRRFRTLISRFTDRMWLAGLIGFLTGALTQSTTAVTIVLTNMNASGLVTVRRALPIVAWSNVGICVLIFITVLDIRLGVLYLLGACGIANVFIRQVTWKSLIGTGLGIGLLLFGMNEVKKYAVELEHYEEVAGVLAHARGSYLLSLVGGTLIAFLTQSTTAAILIALAMVDTRVLGVDETIMAIYGGNVGSTFARMLLALSVKGSSRQIGKFQDLLKISGCVLFAALFYLEYDGGIPLVRALAEAITPRVETQMAVVNLVFNLTMASLFTLLMPSIETLLNRYWPALETEDIARVEYLHPQALNDPETAVDLVEKEQARLVGRLPQYLTALRAAADGKPRLDHQDMHRAFGLLWREVDAYLTTLSHLPMSPQSSARITNVQGRNGVIGLLEENLFQLVTAVLQSPPSGRLAPLVDGFVEALDFILLTAGEMTASRSKEDARLLATLCSDRGELMGKLRSVYLVGERDLPLGDRSLLLELTTLFDRAVWMLHRLAGQVEQGRLAEA